MKKNLLLILATVSICAFVVFVPPALAANDNSNSAPPINTGGPCKSDTELGVCVTTIYRWALGAGVLLALIEILFAGYQYITSGGNAQSVTAAKEKFAMAFIGLIVLFAAVLILRTINPDLLKTDYQAPQNWEIRTNNPIPTTTSTNPTTTTAAPVTTTTTLRGR